MNELKTVYDQAKANAIEQQQWVTIPGPNPILTEGDTGTWDDEIIESCDILHDGDTYYLYYHACGQGHGYRIGVATAKHPLGPFVKHGNAPVLELGTKGSWDDMYVACAMVVKRVAVEGKEPDTYYMWYSAKGKKPEHSQWGVGLATAEHPLGPWQKYDGNPLLAHFGYVGGVVPYRGKYYMYNEHPISSTSPDYGPFALAIADKPEGPWQPWPENPVLADINTGEWDDGGYSEAEVVYHNGVFHLFYGGGKTSRPRLTTRESIGYAYSLDGIHFTKHRWNPVVNRDLLPNVAAMSEVHALIEPPFVYLYHTLRYKTPPSEKYGKRWPHLEHMGVQVVAMQKPFMLDMPVWNLASLAGGTQTALEEACLLKIESLGRLALTVRCRYGSKAKEGLRLRVKSSSDGCCFDTTDWQTVQLEVRPGQQMQQTVSLPTNVRFIKVLVENPDASDKVTDIGVIASMGS